MNLSRQEEYFLQEEYPGIDLDLIKYYLKSFTFTEIKHKLQSSKIYPIAPTFTTRNYKFHQILEISQGHATEIRNLIFKDKNIYEILDILSVAENSGSSEFDMTRLEFKSEEYLLEAEKLLLYEFSREFWTFKIRQVLITENSYIKSRQVLLNRKRNVFEKLYFQMFSIFYNQNSEELSMLFSRVSNSNLQREIQKEISKQDGKLAKSINNEQYSNLKEEIQCKCCFQGKSWEELSSCKGGHLFCRDCILSLVRESLFGTGKMRGHTIKCVDIDGSCQEEILDIERFVPKTLLEKYYSLITLTEIQKAGIKLTKCPFCNYAEENTFSDSLLRKGRRWIARMITYDRVKSFLPMTCFFISFLLTLYFQGSARNLYFSLFVSAFLKKRLDFVDLKRIIQKIQGLLKEKYAIFNCKLCLKASCVNCQGEWKVDHECHDKEKSSFRLFVEKRMSEALLRTCPKCRISFSKSDGCNKITCPQCKYSMCFICKTDIRREKYAHFCNHFRIIPGPCPECKKCDLYIAPDDDKLVNKAAEDARIEWLSNHADMSTENIDFSLDNIG